MSTPAAYLTNARAQLTSAVGGTGQTGQPIPTIQQQADGTYLVSQPAKKGIMPGFKNWHMLLIAGVAIAGAVAAAVFWFKKHPLRNGRGRPAY